MAITKKDIEHVSRLARIVLKESEKEKLTLQLSAILDYIDQLKKVNTERTEPLSQPVPLHNAFRSDTARASGLQNKILKQAPEQEDTFFKVKKVIE